ncbi:MAG TPA: Lsr2 family protein [Jiangellaceae bacterium]|nr:Lsr2 family protein [Jiangellaceae bacterium]
MAQKVQVFLEDDIEGGEAAKTVSFTWGGTDYEIDLSDKNAKKFAKAIDPYVAAARRVPASKRTNRRATTKSSGAVPSGVDTVAVRKWAQSNGYKVSARGRIPTNVIDAYLAAGN